MHGRALGEEPLRSNFASDRAGDAANVVPFSAAASNPEPARRLSPLASLIAVVLLSLATWAAIGAAVGSLLAR